MRGGWRTGSLSNLSYAAVDEHFAARHETAVVRSEEERDGGNLLRPAYPAQCCFGDQGLDRVFLPNRGEMGFEALYARRQGRARGEHIDANSGAPQVERPTAGEIADRRLARAVDAEARRARRARR